jgi:methylase of polypeptide subunit release factors
VSIHVFPTVYPTGEVSELVCDCLDTLLKTRSKTLRVLDYGTGTGFLAIQAALKGLRTVAIDINPHSIACGYHNAVQAGIAHLIKFRLSDGLNSLNEDEQFEIILAGLPWDNASTDDFTELGMYDPEFRMRNSLFDQLDRVLAKNGCVLFTYSETAEIRNPIKNWTAGCLVEICAKKKINGESHFVYRIEVDRSIKGSVKAMNETPGCAAALTSTVLKGRL